MRDGTREFLDEPVYCETYFMIPVTLRFNQGLKDLGAVRPLGPFGGGRVAGDPGPGMASVEPPGCGAAQSGSRSGRGRPLTGDWAGVSL